MRALSAVPTTWSCVQIYLWIRDTSLYRTTSWVPIVSFIERFHCVYESYAARLNLRNYGGSLSNTSCIVFGSKERLPGLLVSCCVYSLLFSNCIQYSFQPSCVINLLKNFLAVYVWMCVCIAACLHRLAQWLLMQLCCTVQLFPWSCLLWSLCKTATLLVPQVEWPVGPE